MVCAAIVEFVQQRCSYAATQQCSAQCARRCTSDVTSSECNDARAMVQRRSESAPAMPDPAMRRRVCAQCTVEAGVQRCGPSLWSRENSITLKIIASVRMLTSESVYRQTAAWCSSSVLAEARQHKGQGLLKIKAARRVVSLRGMRQEPTRALPGFCEIQQKPARIFQHPF